MRGAEAYRGVGRVAVDGDVEGDAVVADVVLHEDVVLVGDRDLLHEVADEALDGHGRVAQVDAVERLQDLLEAVREAEVRRDAERLRHAHALRLGHVVGAQLVHDLGGGGLAEDEAGAVGARALLVGEHEGCLLYTSPSPRDS